MRKHTFGIVAALCVGVLLCAVSGDVLAATSLTLNSPMISADALAAIAAGGGIGSIAVHRSIERKDGGGDGGLSALMAEVKKELGTFMSSFEEFKKTNDDRIKQIEKKGVADPVTLEKLNKIEADMAKGDDLSQKLVKLEAEQKAQKEAQDEIEKKLNRPRAPSADPDAIAAYKSMVNNWGHGVVRSIIQGDGAATEDQRKALQASRDEHKSLNVTNDTLGGYLAPTEFVGEITKGIVEYSPVRSLVRVRTTRAKSIQIPKRTGVFSAVWVQEQGPKSETTGLNYGLDEISAHELYALVDISNQMLEDSAFDMEAEIRTESVEQFAVAEGAAVVSGSGVGRPEGFLTNKSVAETVSGAATAVTADGVLNLKYDVKTGYTRNAHFVMNRSTMKTIRTLKDGNGQYLWMPGLAQGRPNSIDGDPYAELPDMPNQGAGAYPVAYGDFRRAYILVDRIVLEMLRDPYTQATSGNIRFIMRKRLGGQVVLAEAIRKLKCST